MKLQELVSILETSFDAGILVNESGNIHFLNSAALDFFGNPNESLQNIGINEALVFLNKETNTPLLWKEVKQSLNESITVIVKSKDDKDTLSGEARQTEIGEYTLLFIRPSSSSANNNNLAASMVEASLDPVFTISSDGIIQMVNSAACRLFQYTQEEFVGSNISIIAGGIHEEHHDGYMENYLLTKEAKVMGKRRRLPAKRKDGCEFVIELSVVEIRGQQHLFCGFVRDLTDILASQALVTSILDAALDPLFQVNEHGIIQMVNKAATAQFGWTRDEFIGSNISMIVGPEHASKHDQYMDRYLKTGEARVMGTKRELPARRKDGSEFIIQLSLVEVKVENGDERLFCGFVHDLTEQKALMASIERERNLIAGVIDASLDPLFQVNETGIIQMVNKAASTQFGWTHDEFLGSNINMIVGGEHAARHGQYMERYLKTGEARVMGTKRELPARRKDGSEFIVELSLVEVPVDEGQERIFCGFIFDLTEQKKHLQDIQRREAFTNKIIEGSYDALFVTDKNGNITRVNTTAVKKFESSRDDLSKLSIFSLLNSNHASWLQGEVEKYLTTGIPTTTQREVEAIRPCGDAFPVAIGVSEMEGPDGEPYFAVYMHDLSERKRMLQIEAEKAAAEYLLFNMLPETIAGRLKNDPSHIAESHSFAAVLFADIVGFTSMSSMMEPHEVVSMLNDLFSMFDEVVERYDLNKVKTIGGKSTA
jgi:PAS domain S-box-containing protein